MKAIIDICGLEGKEISLSDVIYKIGPRLNASGRIENGRESVELLVCNDPVQAMHKAAQINH